MALKMWDDPSWKRKLTGSLAVGMVDDDRGAGSDKRWYLGLTQSPDLLARKKVAGFPRRGRSLLLDDDAVVALVRHLLDSGLVQLTETGEVLNGPKWDHDHPMMMTEVRAKRKRKRR